MSLLWIDSFDHYATADIAKKYVVVAGTTTILPTGGRRSSGAIQFSGATSVAQIRAFTSPNNTAIVGCAHKYNATPSVGTIGIYEIRTVAAAQIALCISSANLLHVRRGNSTSGTVIASGPTLTPGAFIYLEMKVLIHPSAGTLALKVNGVDAFVPLTGLNTSSTGSSAWDLVSLGNGNAGASVTQQLDDLYILDGGGSAPWNDWIGDCRVDARLPTGAGATTGWTPSTGTNWQNVDDATPDGDTTYNSTPTVNAIDTFVVQDAPLVGATILGVQQCINVKKSDSGAGVIASVIRHAGTDNISSDIIVGSTTYGYGTSINQTNPGTGLAWVESDFNAAEFGYKRIS